MSIKAGCDLLRQPKGQSEEVRQGFWIKNTTHLTHNINLAGRLGKLKLPKARSKNWWVEIILSKPVGLDLEWTNGVP